jgi:hypothetical protein
MNKMVMGCILLFVCTVCFSQQKLKISGRVPPADSPLSYRIQVGSFRLPANAERTFNGLRRAGFDPAYEQYRNFTRVFLRGIRAARIRNVLRTIESLGFTEAWITEDRSSALSERILTEPRGYTITAGDSILIRLEETLQGVVWSSGDPGVAEVDEDGQLFGITPGSTVIEARYPGTVMRIPVTVVPASNIQSLPRDKESFIVVDENTRATPGSAFLAEYKTEPSSRLAYRFVNPGESRGASGIPGGVDIIGKGKDDTWMWTTYYQGGFFYDLNGLHRGMVNGILRSPDDMELAVEPSFVYIDGAPYLQLNHRLTNHGSATVTGQKFGAGADIMIHTNDHAPITLGEDYLRMTDSNDPDIETLSLVFIGNAGNGAQPVSSLWVGRWERGEHLKHIYDHGMDSAYSDGVDSAMAFSFQDITLLPGESKNFVVLFALIQNNG